MDNWKNYLPYILLFFVFFWISTWILFKLIFRLISKEVRKKMELKLSVLKIHFTYLEGLTIEKEGVFMCHIEHIGINSSWINSSCNKPITLFVGPSTVELLNCFPEERQSKMKKTTVAKEATFLNTLAASSLRVFFQHCGVVLQNLSVSWQLGDVISAWSADIKIAIDLKSELSRLGIKADFMNCKLTALQNDMPLLFISHEFHIRSSFVPGKAISETTHKLDISSLALDMSEGPDEGVVESSSSQEDFITILSKLPKKIKIGLENIKLVYRLNDKREFQMDWNCVLSWDRRDNDSFEVGLDILGFIINGRNHCKLLLFKQVTSKINICTENCCDRLNFECKVDTFHLDFIYEEILFWKNHFLAVHESYLKSVRSASDGSNSRTSSFLSQCVFAGDITLQNCSCDLYHALDNSLGASILFIYLGNFSFSVTDGSLLQSTAKCRSFLNDIYCYIDIEHILPLNTCSLPCQLVDDEPTCLPSSERHAWGRLIEIGKASFECDLADDIINCESSITYIAMEWSLALGESLLYIAHRLPFKPLKYINVASPAEENSVSNKSYKVEVDIHAENLNLFIIGDKEGGYNSFLHKIDVIKLTGGNNHMINFETNGMVFTQLKELQRLKTGDTFYCFKSEKFTDNLLGVTHMTVVCKKEERLNVSVEVSSFVIGWSSNIHMALYEQINDVKAFSNSLQHHFKISSSEPSTPPSSTSSSLKETPLLSPAVSVNLNSFSVQATTALGHSFSIEARRVSVTLNESAREVTCPDCSICFDGREIFRCEDVQLQELLLNELRDERTQFKNISGENKAWGIAIHSVYINFQYGFNFGESLEKSQNVIKMLKLLHKKPKPKDYIETLPPDLLITLENVSIEFDDDPFEVHLNDNYLLLNDEIEQAMERDQKMETKLNQIRTEKGAMISGKKLDELRRSLKEKNAQIYIERSKEMYEERGPRKTLFLVALKGIELAVLADESLHGKNNVLTNMALLNEESIIPDNIQFTTLWCRMVRGKCDFMRMLLRDYPQPLVAIETFTTRGMVIGSEMSGVEAATRDVQLKIGAPWKDMTLKKNMPPLKFFYDLKWDMSSCQVAWGANFEPTFSMVTQAFDLLSKKSVDPSTPLPFWDKIRLLLHGHLKVDIPNFNILLSASTDPYNTTEMLEIEWTTVTLEWTNGCVCIDGDFDLHTRTASKYDDSKVVHFPAFTMCFHLEWLCEGDPNDHHSVYPTCTAHATTEDHDSYARFRSTNLNMNVTMVTCNEQTEEEIESDPPFVFLYASTFRWFQNYQAVVINRVSRPIKRGNLFLNPKATKPTLGRHLKLVSVDWKFPSLNVAYWGSFQQEIGFETIVHSGSLSVAYQVFITPHPDANLRRRPVTNWIIRGLNSTLEQTRLSMLQSIEQKLNSEVTNDELLRIEEDDAMDVIKHYLFSVDKVEYQRQSAILEDCFTHKILLYGFKGAWTAINRELVVGLFEAYTKMQKLKQVLASEALKMAGETMTTDQTKREKSASISGLLDSSNTKSPLTRMQSGHGVMLLQQLLSEQSSKFIAQSEEGETTEHDLDASLDVGEDDDIIQKNWHIELVNSQVLLHGTESKGALIVTAGNATIFKRLHKPLCAATDILTKLNKVTWCCKFRKLQYFSTVSNFKDITVDNIPWLTSQIICGNETKENEDPHSLSSFTRTSDAVGAFVDVSVQKSSYQLQRVISRCECEFRYVSLDDELDPVAEEYVPSIAQTTESIEDTVSLATTLNLKHGRLDISTSTSQYAVITDIFQNLIFYTEPKRKEEQEKLEKMKFKLQLTTGQDLKGNVSQLQTRVRRTLTLLRRYERTLFDYKKKEEELKETDGDLGLLNEIEEILSDLQEQVEVTKDQLFEDVEELKILISAYKDIQQIKFAPSPQKGVSYIRKKIDVQLDDVQWLITQEDGQLGIANVYIRKFKYNQLTYKDDHTEHCFEIGNFCVKNLLPNEAYREALIPHEVTIRRHLDKSVVLRIFCRLSPPVAGISVKEHFEVNVCPIAVRLTHKLFVNMERFLFPKSQAVEKQERTEFQSGFQAPTIVIKDDSKGEETKENELRDSKLQPTILPLDPKELKGEDALTEKNNQTDKTKTAPPRPPPPRNLPQRPPPPRRLSSRARPSDATIKEEELDGAVMKRKNSAGLEVPLGSPPSNLPPTTPKSASFKRTFFRDTFSSADRDVNTMKERAAKNQTFIYVKIPEVPVCFSYKGEKERNIEDAHDFNLCLPTLEYHGRTWTWQDLFQAMKKDYTQTLVPQILKEKLHLKSAGADTKPSIAQVDDTNKAKLLFGDKSSNQKKSAKKALFGKLLKTGKTSSGEKLNDASVSVSSSSLEPEETEKKELMGKGVEPSNLQQTFNQLRDLNDRS